MHICLISREFPPSKRGGGISTYLKELSNGLVSAGHKVTVICASDDTVKESCSEKGNLTVIRLSGGDFLIPLAEKSTLLKKFRIFYRFYSYRRKIKKTLLKLSDIDIVECAEYGAESYCLSNIDIPVVVRLHCPQLFDFRTLGICSLNARTWKTYWQGHKEITCIAKADYISSPSTAMAKWGSYFANIPIEKISIIPNFIHRNEAKKEIRRKENVALVVDNKELHILYVGTFCDFKGCEELCDAVQILRNSGLNIRLQMIGKQGKYVDYLKAKYKNDEWLNLQGFTPREEIMKMYSLADVVCFPSWFESFSIVCIEAMQQGAIVVGSTSGGMSEIISDGEDGFLVPPQNVQLLSEGIRKALSLTASQRLKMSEAAKKKINEIYDGEVVLDKIIRFYTSCIDDYKKR